LRTDSWPTAQSLTIRRSDATILASILDCPTDQVSAKLDDLGLRLTH
jgi:hypothetical protein